MESTCIASTRPFSKPGSPVILSIRRKHSPRQALRTLLPASLRVSIFFALSGLGMRQIV